MPRSWSLKEYSRAQAYIHYFSILHIILILSSSLKELQKYNDFLLERKKNQRERNTVDISTDAQRQTNAFYTVGC